MRKQNNYESMNNANIVLKTVLISLYHIGKLYGPALDNLARQYVELKKEKKACEKTNQTEKKIEYIKKQQEVMQEAKKIISPIEEMIANELMQKMELMLYEAPNQTEIVSFRSKKQWIVMILELAEQLDRKEKENRIQNFARKAPILENSYKNQLISTGFISLCLTISLNIFLNMGGIKEHAKTLGMHISECMEWIQEDIESTFETIEDFFGNEEILEVESYEVQFEKISNNKRLSSEEKIRQLLDLNATNYKNTFDAVLEIPDSSYEYKINAIIHSDLVDFRTIYNYLIENKKIPQEPKMKAIANSNRIAYQINFQYLLKDAGLKPSESIEYIVNSKHTYQEKFSFIFNEKSLNFDQKIWSTLLIKDVPFSIIFQDLITTNHKSVTQIIESIIKADIVPFETLFNTLLESKLVREEEFIEAFLSYQSAFHVTTRKDKINYILNTKIAEETKLNIFWEVLDFPTVTEKEKYILDYYEITDVHEFTNLYKKKEKELTIDEQRLLALYKKINEVKIDYIIEHYEMGSIQELYDTVGGVAAESDGTYDDCCGVTSTFFNRITDTKYALVGKNPYLQFIEPGQFAVYYYKTYQKYTQPKSKAYEQIFNTALQAFCDTLYMPYNENCYGEEKIKHDFIEFRSPTEKNFKAELQLTPRGNVYGVHKRGEVIHEDLFKNRDLLSEKDQEILNKGIIRERAVKK